jgi:hypothetical protein
MVLLVVLLIFDCCVVAMDEVGEGEEERARTREKRVVEAEAGCLAWTDRQSPAHMTRMFSDYLCLSSAKRTGRKVRMTAGNEIINTVSGYIVGGSCKLCSHVEWKTF